MIQTKQTDVAIVGGGLAGLTLALQLRKSQPDLEIQVIERQSHPLPVAIAKVGESTVEIGSHYFAHTLDQRAHLEESQLPKFGFRLFFGEAGDDLSSADELGSSRLLKVPTYQLDRGLLENHLALEAQREGIQFCHGTRVTALDTQSNSHSVSIKEGANQRAIKCRWLIDAAGRTSVLKQRLKLGRDNSHHCNAIWFRVAAKIAVDEWSDNGHWHDRCTDLNRKRWLSTNHLMGQGYWVWIIPLSSGATSIGIVFDPDLHDVNKLRNYADALTWLEQHQPRCAEAIRGVEVLDYRVLRHYSHDCQQVFSDQRWALSGESGVFLDPFYSPGSDFIAISNTYIVDLIKREMSGENIRTRGLLYQQLYMSFYNSTLALYEGLYPGFGDRKLMMLKTVWDYAFYWGILSLLFFNEVLTDVGFMSANGSDLRRVQLINQKLQGRFRQRAVLSKRLPPRAIFVDQSKIPCLRNFNAELVEQLDSDALQARVKRNVAMLESLAGSLEAILDDESTTQKCSQETELLGDLRFRLAA